MSEPASSPTYLAGGLLARLRSAALCLPGTGQPWEAGAGGGQAPCAENMCIWKSSFPTGLENGITAPRL